MKWTVFQYFSVFIIFLSLILSCTESNDHFINPPRQKNQYSYINCPNLQLGSKLKSQKKELIKSNKIIFDAIGDYQSKTNNNPISDDTICIETIIHLEELAMNYLWEQNNIDSSQYYLEIQESLFSDDSKVNSFKYKNYYSQASINRRKKNYIVALNYVNSAIQSVTIEPILDSIRLISCMKLRANINYEMKNNHDAISDYEQILKYYQKKHLNELVFLAISGLADIHLRLKDSIRTITYINKLMTIPEINSLNHGIATKNKATFYSEYNKLDSSIIYYKKAINILGKHNRLEKHYYSETCYMLSISLFQNNKVDEAILYGNKAISHYKKHGKLNYGIMEREPNAIRFLSGLANSHVYKSRTQKDTNIDEDSLASYYYKTAERLIENQSIYNDEDVVMINEASLNSYYSEYIDFLYFKYQLKKDERYLKQIIVLLTKYKSQGLQRNLTNNSPEEASIVKLKKQKRKNKKQLELLKFNQDKKQIISKKLHIKLEKSLLKRDKILNDSIINLQEKQNFKLIDPLDLIEQYAIKTNSLVMDFFIPKNKRNVNPSHSEVGYVFLTDGYNSQIQILENIKTLNQYCNKYNEALTQNNTKSITNYSKKLYQYFNKYWELYDMNSLASLVIIPDNNLRKIPFGSLQETKPGKQTFLIESKSISYRFTSKSLINQISKTIDQKILVFSHSDKETLFSEKIFTLSELSGGYKETNAIKDVFKDKCRVFSGFNATKKSFLQEAPNYNYIHLAMHGKADQLSRHTSCIYFRSSNNLVPLYPYELLDQYIKPELLFLSACETATGKMYSQEGMFSIARAFYGNGCKRVISSLWDLDDHASSLIVTSFYKILNKHPQMSIEQVLQKAKLRYLRKKSFSQVSPSHWSSLVLYQ